MAKQSKQRPVHEERLGRIRAAVWANETDNGVRHNVTVSRLYKDADEWKDSYSFGRDDLPVLAKVLDRAHSWIFDNRNGSAIEEGASTEEGSNENAEETPF